MVRRALSEEISMTKPFKFRYVNEIAGAFVLVVILALLGGVLVAARAQRW